jgi:hypothetical protein
MTDKGEDQPSPDGGRALPPNLSPSADAVTEALASGELQTVNLSTTASGQKPLVPSPIPHGSARLWIAGGALAICLIGPCTPLVPRDIKTAFLTIAGSIATSLFKGFEKY